MPGAANPIPQPAVGWPLLRSSRTQSSRRPPPCLNRCAFPKFEAGLRVTAGSRKAEKRLIGHSFIYPQTQCIHPATLRPAKANELLNCKESRWAQRRRMASRQISTLISSRFAPGLVPPLYTYPQATSAVLALACFFLPNSLGTQNAGEEDIH